MVILFSFLISCSNKVIEKGYGYDLELSDIMVGARIENTIQNLDSAIEIELAYGHPKSQDESAGIENSTPGPICIYTDNHYEKDNHEVNSLDYRLVESNWDYVSEVPYSSFWTDEYAFDNDFIKGKKFYAY